MRSVLKCKISYKIRKIYLIYPVAPQRISTIRILIVEFLHHNLKHSQLHIQLDSLNTIHLIKHTIIHTQFETQ